MKTEPQNGAELTLLGKLVGASGVATLRNHDDAGVLISRPMSLLEMDADGALWFFVDLRSNEFKHLGVVNLSFTHRVHGTYVSIVGRGEIVIDPVRKRRLWTSVAELGFPDGLESQNIALLKVVPHVAEYLDTVRSKMVCIFANTALMVAEHFIEWGGHDGGVAMPMRKFASVTL